MATSLTADNFGNSRDDIGYQCSRALDLLFPDGRNRNKGLQRLLDCSMSMVKDLLAGKHWTIARMEQVARLRPAFYSMVFDALESAAPAEDDVLKLLEQGEAHIRRARQLLGERQP
jgi:hypothetical protein